MGVKEKRAELAEAIRGCCDPERTEDLRSALRALESVFKDYKLVAVNVPEDEIVFGGAYIDQEEEKLRIQEAEEKAARAAARKARAEKRAGAVSSCAVH